MYLNVILHSHSTETANNFIYRYEVMRHKDNSTFRCVSENRSCPTFQAVMHSLLNTKPRVLLIHILGGWNWHCESTRHVGHWMAYCTCPGWLWWWRILWNKNWQGKPKYSEKTCPSVTLSTTNPTWPDPDSNPGHRSGKPATNHLSYGAAKRRV
jgi:hypothetical protein